jgi:RHS repeat-associated protein
MKKLVATLLFLALPALPAVAEQQPSRTRGHSADSVYQIGDLDTINHFNGNLTIAIPIGQNYSVSPQLSYRLTLAYNSSVWDYEDLLDCLGNKNQPQLYNFPYPTPHSNAGVGWSLHLGRLFAPNDTVYNKHNPNWLYVGPDGSQHNFYSKLHPTETITANVFYSNDGTYLRLDARDSSLLTIESPDGLVRTFSLSQASGRYRLIKTADLFGNWMEISYDTSTWEITDSHGRSHTLTLNGDGDVATVELEAFGGGTATYELSYVAASLERHRFDYPCTAQSGPHPEHTEFVTASLLSGVEQPDGTSFAFTYDTVDNTFSGFSGAIRSMVVPTGGRFEWDYGDYLFQSQAPTLPESSLTLQRGVGARRTYLQSSGGAVHGSWTYEQSASFEVTLPGSPFQVACWHRMRVSDNLSQQVTESYFATAGGGAWWWYGLPYAPCNPDTGSATPVSWSANNANPYLSTRVYERQADGTLEAIRSTYVIYDSDGLLSGSRQDRNHRLRYQKTVYHDDLDGSGNPHTDETINSDFDGFGHYRSVSRKSSFGLEKVVATTFLPANFSYQLNPGDSTVIIDTFDVPAIASPWIHGLSSGSTTSQGGLVSKRETCFDSATGFLQRQRSLAGGSQQSKDVIVEFEEGDDLDGHDGFVVAERVYGGDGGGVPNGSLCGLNLSSPSYVKKNAYQYGSLNRSAWVEPCNEFAEVLVTDEAQIDQSTGLPHTVVEPNGLSVALDYDTMGRLLSEVPEEGASRVHQYIVSPPSYEIRHCPQGTSNFCNVASRLSDRYWSYDRLGRMASKSLAYPGENGDADPSVTYEIDGIGRKTEESTWGGAHKTEFKEFDVFGRARSIEPEGTYATKLVFRGERIKAREVKIATSEGGVQSVFSTEVHDHLGRLIAVCEAAAAVWNGSAGTCTGQLARYSYDQDDRLIHVCQNVQPNGTTCGQQRSFGWDGRGFLTSETHPEIGAAGSGTIVYQRDARGNTTQRDIANDGGDRPLHFTYDGAGRPIRVEEQISTGKRLLKEFFYARENQQGSSERRRGQLVMARRTNWVELLNPLPVEIANVPLMVTDHYEYFGLGGRASKKTTSITLPSGGQSFTTSFVYGLLGDIASIDYPRGDWPHQLAPVRQVTFGRDLGFLTEVPGFAPSITYQLGGTLYEIDYANGWKWRLTPELATGWERPDTIETLNSAGQVSWTTGDYSYDGAGNISRIGDRKYVYDAFSRFFYVQRTGQPQREQEATYDAYGNLTALKKNGNTRVLTTSAATNRLITQEAAYTSNGELAYAVIDGLDFAYGYDGLGQQLFQQTTDKTWVYAYDANDERVLTWECAGNRCGENTNFERYTLRGLGGEVLRVFSGASRAELAWEEDYVYRDGQSLAWVKADPEGEKKLFLHADHLGSTRQVTSTTGLQVARHDFLPFGEESTTSTGGDIKLKFTGHERDQPGRPMDYMHARSASPMLGRFLRVDPSGRSARSTAPQSWNRYIYAGNNPLSNLDPDGRECRMASLLERDIQDRFTGRISSEKYWDNIIGRAQGADIGLSIVNVVSFARGVLRGLGWLGKGAAEGLETTLEKGAAEQLEKAFVRPLEAADLGIKGTLIELKGTFSVTGQKAVARVDMIEAEVGNPLSIIENLANTARAHGATTLRIEGTVANPKLMRVLERKYGFKTEGANEYIELMLN